MSIQLKVKKLHEDAILPKYATEGAACFDLHAINDDLLDEISHPNAIIPTGLAFEVPCGYALMVYSRSGHGFKNCVRLANCVGIIDSDYRGELMVKLTVDLDGSLTIMAGDRIAQAMLLPIPAVEIIEADSLNDTERGTGGFGSTGK